MMVLLDGAVDPLLAWVNEYHLFGAAAVVTIAAFIGLILVPALGSYGRTWEKFAAGFLSLFVLAALVILGVMIGLLVFYEWDKITEFL